MKYRIHYTEKGHNRRIKGRRYNGLKIRIIRASSEEAAIKRLREGYVDDGIKEIRDVEVISEYAEVKERLEAIMNASIV